MKVYIVLEEIRNEGASVCSVWSDKQMAENECSRIEKNKVTTVMIHGEPMELSKRYYVIEEYELNKPIDMEEYNK